MMKIFQALQWREGIWKIPFHLTLDISAFYVANLGPVKKPFELFYKYLYKSHLLCPSLNIVKQTGFFQ